MKNFKKSYLITGAGLLISLTLFSFLFFRKRNVSLPELTTYIANPDNGLLKESNQGKFTVKALFKPSSLLQAQDNARDTAQIKSYKEHYYFIISIAQDNKELEYSLIGDRAAFGNTLQKMMFGMKENVMLLSDTSDTVAVKEFMYPRMYGSTNSSSFIFVFDNKKIQNSEWIDLKLTFDELGLEESFRFKMNDIKSIPDLKM